MNTSKFSFGSRYSISLIIFLTFFILFTTINFASAANKFIVTNTNNDGPGSLRQAIFDANNNQGKDNIVFDIPGAGPHTIQPTFGLPNITDPIIIDGLTQHGAKCYYWPPTLMIELDGSNAGNTNGLNIHAGNSTVRGLVINRFNGNGIYLGTDGDNVIECNFIGTNATGTAELGNSGCGVFVSGNAPNNTIGGDRGSKRNLISGNAFRSVWITSSNNTIAGNYIGTDGAGTAALGETEDGIVIEGGAEFNTIGGTMPGERNIISGHRDAGIWLIGSNNTISGNFIGTDATGIAKLENGTYGITISEGATNNTIGGSSSSARNIISGNNAEGIEIGGSGTIVMGNFIGTDITGKVALGNGGNGIFIHSNAPDNTIGGTTASERNIISGNGFRGIWLNSSNNTVTGNFIGTDVTGTKALGNSDVGLVVEEGQFNIIGGTTAGERNLICASGHFGVWIIGSNNTVSGNFIGTDITGLKSLGNGWSGLEIHWGVSNNMIGGTAKGAGNLISGNAGHGVGMYHSGTCGNIVQGNFIGTNRNGDPCLGNGCHGVDIEQGACNNTVGGDSKNAKNIIAGNGQNGVQVSGNGTFGNQIQGNSIFSNEGLGIDLWGNGVTPNDPEDLDAGPNNLQNYPILTSAISLGSLLTVSGTIDTPNPETVTIEFFVNPTADPSGHGEGFKFHGSAQPDAQGEFTVNLPYVLPGFFISATATDADGNTSEFSANIEVVSGGALPKPSISVDVAEEEITLPEAFGLSQNYPNPFNPETIIQFQLPEASQVVLKIFNLLGEEVRTLVNSKYQAGYHTIKWDGTDRSGNSVSNGVYLYRIEAGSFSKIMKMSLLR